MGQILGLMIIASPFIVAGVLITTGQVSTGGRNKIWIGAALLFAGLGIAGGGFQTGHSAAALGGLVAAAVGIYLMYNGFNDKETVP